VRRIRLSLSLGLVLAAAASGCGDGSGNPGTVPASTDSASTHAFIENPGGIKEKPSTKSKAAKAMPPQPLK
jgi:hypothetical protein